MKICFVFVKNPRGLESLYQIFWIPGQSKDNLISVVFNNLYNF